MNASQQDAVAARFPCPVCGKSAFDAIGEYEICGTCGWEDDPVQLRVQNYAGGANASSLNEARARYLATCAPRRSPPGVRGDAEIGEILAHRAARAMAYFSAIAEGKTPRECPICGYVGPFSPVKHKPEIWCPGCDSRPRHRLMKLWMDREMRLAPGARVLHFAAEPWVAAEMAARGADYRTADLNDKFELRLDITAIDLPDSSLDMVIANHVLEHVDDRAAIAEIHRILRPGGQAVLTVPLIEGFDRTYEDPAHDTAEARRLHYGDADHLRWYGRDFRDRLAAPGFAVTEFTALEPDASRHALHRGEKIFIGTKPATGED